MAFSLAEEAFLGEFQSTEKESQVLKLNEAFFENVQKLSSLEEFDSNFKACQSNAERVDLFSKYFPSSGFFHSMKIDDYTKSEGNSTKFRELGNACFRNRDLVGALRAYNLAVSYAPETQQLGLAFANRSVVFLETGELRLLKECLQDITLALLNGYPVESKPKLEQRRLKCSKKIEQLRASTTTTVEDSGNYEAIENFKENVLFKIQNPNPEIPCAELGVEILIHPIRGRELAVTRDIPPGTTLIVENPFVQILKNPLQWDFRHCQHSLNIISGGIPCNGCVFANYSNSDWRDKAFKDYHQYECPCWPYLHLNQTPRFVLLTLRLVSKLGPAGASRLFKNPKELTLKTSIYDSSSYSSIYQLISHENAQSEIEDFSNVMQSLILVRLLEEMTPFLAQLDGDVNHELFRPWLAQLILQHLQSVPYNSLALEEIKVEGLGQFPSTDPESIRKAQFEQYASGLYPTISLINHSCDPNVTRLSDSANEGRMCIVTLRSLKGGESLFTSYTKSFQDPLLERQQFLSDNYHFRCSCQACSENWPPLSHSRWGNQEPRFRCSACRNQILKNGSCGSCKKRGNQKKHLAEYKRIVEEFYDSYNLIVQNQPLESIEKLGPVLEYFQTKLVGPFGKTFLAQDALKRGLDLVVCFHKN